MGNRKAVRRMALSESDFNDYAAAIDGQADEAAGRMADYVASLPLDGGERARNASREAIKAAFVQEVEGSGDVSAERAARLYEELADAEGVSVPQALIARGMSFEELESIAAYITDAQGQGAEGRQTQVQQAMANAIAAQVVRMANDTIERNATRDHVKWQRVTQSPVPCAFCAVLASRGAMYSSQWHATYKAAGGRYHDNCRCVAVPCFDGQDVPFAAKAVSGYLEDYFDARHMTSDSSAWEGWKALSDEARNGYGSYSQYRFKKILSGMRKIGAYTH